MANIDNELNQIKNAVYGKDVRGSIHDGIDKINKETEKTTNEQESLSDQFKQLIIDAGNSNAEVVASRGKEDWLPDRLNSVDSQLAHTEKDIEQVKYDNIHNMKNDQSLQVGDKVKVWGYFEKGDGGESEYIIIDTSEEADDLSMIELNGGLKARLVRSSQSVYHYFPYFVDNLNENFPPHGTLNGKAFWELKADDIFELYNEFVAKNPSYVSSNTWGKDSSGQYDLRAYVFDPGNTNKTIFLSAGVHGLERSAVVALYYIMKTITSVGHIEPSLYDLRYKTKIVVMPLVNPNGFNRVRRYNFNDVDINRNFDHNHAQSTDVYKGSAPFSEKESQFVRDIIDSYDHDNVVVYWDYHSGNQPTLYQINLGKNTLLLPVVENAQKYLKNKYPNRTSNASTTNTQPMGYLWARKTFGIEGGNPEWDSHAFGGIEMEGTQGQLQAVTEWFFALLLEAGKSDNLETNNSRVLLTHDGFHSNVDGQTLKTTSDVYSKIPGFEHTFRPSSNGILVVKGSVVLRNTDLTSINYLRVDCTQGESPYGMFYPLNSKESYYEGGGRMTLPVQDFFMVMPYSENFQTVKLDLRWRTTAGTLEVNRAFIEIEFIPNINAGKIIEVGSKGEFQRFPKEF